METHHQIHLNNAIEACITITNDFHLIGIDFQINLLVQLLHWIGVSIVTNPTNIYFRNKNHCGFQWNVTLLPILYGYGNTLCLWYAGSRLCSHCSAMCCSRMSCSVLCPSSAHAKANTDVNILLLLASLVWLLQFFFTIHHYEVVSV